MTNVPLLKGLVVSEFGKVQSVTCEDFEGAAQDISTYTGIDVVCRSPDGKKTVTSTGAFVTTGTDGNVAWSFTSSSYLDRPGIWESQVVLRKTNYKSKSYIFDCEVDKALS